ncbi:hypothetical protein Tco_0720201, partial [Tanacetum coccineum]
MLLLAAKGLLLAVYGGRMVERDNFSPQQPPQTHRQERLTNKRWAMMSLLVGRNRGKAVCILAWQLTKVAAMADVFCFSDGFQEVVRKIVYVAAFDSFKKYGVYVKNEGFLQVRLLMLLFAAKGLLLAVYGGRTVERDNFSHQQPPQTHRQERLTNKVRLLMLLFAAKGLLLAVYGGRTVERDNFSHQQPPQTHRQERLTNKRWAMMSLLVGRNRGKAVCILAWQLTKVAAMADVFCFSDLGLVLAVYGGRRLSAIFRASCNLKTTMQASLRIRVYVKNEGFLQVRLLMLLLAAKGLLLAVYGGRTVERDNFSHQQPPQTHRQERLTNKLAYTYSMPLILSLTLSMACDDSDGCVTIAMEKDEIYVECGRIIGELAAMAGLFSEYSEFLKKGKAVCILAWQLTKVAAMADVFLLRLPRSRLQKIAPHSMATSGSTERWAAASLSESHPVREIEREGCEEVESGQGKYTKQASALDLILRLNNHRSYSDSHNQR